MKEGRASSKEIMDIPCRTLQAPCRLAVLSSLKSLMKGLMRELPGFPAAGQNFPSCRCRRWSPTQFGTAEEGALAKLIQWRVTDRMVLKKVVGTAVETQMFWGSNAKCWDSVFGD